LNNWPLRRVKPPRVVAAPRRSRGEPYRLLKRKDSFFDPALLGERHAKVKLRPAKRGIKLNGFAKVLDASLDIARFSNQLSKIAIGVRIIRIEPERLLEVSSGEIETPLSSIQVTEIVTGDSIIGL